MRAEKIQLLNEIGELLGGAEFVFLVTYKGLSVKNFSRLRASLAAHPVTCRVLKNRLILKAAAERGIPGLSELKELHGDTAVIAGRGDICAVAKAVAVFAKEFTQVAAKAGVMGGRLLTAAEIRDLAGLPPRPILQAQLLGLLQAPARNLVNVLYGKASQLVNLLHNYERKLAGAA